MKQPISVRLDQGLWEEVHAHAQEQGCTRTSVLERALRESLGVPGPESRAQEVEREMAELKLAIWKDIEKLDSRLSALEGLASG